MLKYRIQSPELETIVSLDSDNPNQSGALSYSGDEVVIGELRTYLQRAYGAFGHRVGDIETTPIDLDRALKSPDAKRLFSPELIEGAELVTVYDPQIPEDSVT